MSMVTKACARCGSSFTVLYKNRRQKHCSLSCGAKAAAYQRDGHRNSNWRGGKTSHPLYWVWSDMVRRCHYPKHPSFVRYGARGIAVCDRWRNDFWVFVEDMGERPGGEQADGRALYSLDRIDNDGPYSPENVRWATPYEQRHNQRRVLEGTAS